MRIFGLIGYQLGYSFSERYFTKKFQNEKITDCIYLNFPIDNIQKLRSIILENQNLQGLNVTIPYKEQVIPFLDEIDDEAKEIGAVNTIKIFNESGKNILKGYNSDAFGFQNTLQPLLEKHHQKALILGTGGASRAIKFILHKLNIEYISASIVELRPNEIRYEEIDRKMLNDRLLIIHATPLGTFPNINNCPNIPYQFITNKHLLYDLVYNPEETLFLKKGKEMGATIINGLKMLHMQAERSWTIWNS
jgi:shikimate dehydrogenase